MEKVHYIEVKYMDKKRKNKKRLAEHDMLVGLDYKTPLSGCMTSNIGKR